MLSLILYFGATLSASAELVEQTLKVTTPDCLMRIERLSTGQVRVHYMSLDESRHTRSSQLLGVPALRDLDRRHVFVDQVFSLESRLFAVFHVDSDPTRRLFKI